MRGALALTLAAAVAAAACAGPAQKKPASSPGMYDSDAVREPGPEEELYGASMQRKDEIQDLWMQIRTWRVDGGYQADPPPLLIQRAMTLSVSELRVCEQYPEPRTTTCKDVCSLRDAICDNAESICRIADELEGDPWATEKCNSAKGSCKEATERCCTCVGEEGISPSGDACGGADAP